MESEQWFLATFGREKSTFTLKTNNAYSLMRLFEANSGEVGV